MLVRFQWQVLCLRCRLIAGCGISCLAPYLIINWRITMQNYEIYALRYAAPFTSSGAFLMWLRDREKVEIRNYYFWCLKGPGDTVISNHTPQRRSEHSYRD